MPTANDLIAGTLSTTQKLLVRFTEDLTPQEYLHRACAGGNAIAWIIGHLVVSERSALARAGVKPEQMPALPEGFEKRFGREADAAKAGDFGDVTLLMPLFNRHRELLIDTIRNLPPEALDAPLPKPHPLFGQTVGDALNFMAGPHPSMHAGQISMIRRTMGKPPLI